MSTKLNNRLNISQAILAISIHLFWVFGGVFFLTPEFTLYPYFVQQGLLPYQQIIDQHFPMLFFGPISLSVNPLLLFAGTLVLTDLFAWMYLLRTKLNNFQRTYLLFAFICIEIIFGGQTLWIETFGLLFITAALMFGTFKSSLLKLIAGFCWGMLISLRPNLTPLVILLWWIEGYSIWILTGIVLPLIWTGVWLIQNQLLKSFKALVFTFNTQVYTNQARLLPSARDITWVSLTTIVGFFTSANWAQIGLWILMVGLVFTGVFPRFDMVHLLPLAGIWLWWISKFSRRTHLVLLWTIVILSVLFIKRYPFKSVNFYYPPRIYQMAQIIQTRFGKQSIYYLGGPDQLYVLTHTTPPGDYYLPSLPWYLDQTEFVDKEIDILVHSPSTLISVNQDSRVDGKNLIDYSQSLQKLIKAEYMPIDQVGPLTIYQHI